MAMIFRALAREWWERDMLVKCDPDYAAESWRRLETHLLPYVGEREVKRMTAPQFLKPIRRVEALGTPWVARKIKSHASQIMQYGIACGATLRNPVRDLGAALKPIKSTSRAAITEPRQIGGLMRDIETYCADGGTPDRVKRQCMLKLSALLFQRPGETASAAWEDIEVDDALWRIPANRMKMKRPHSVPLPKQALAVLRVLRPITGDSPWLFPSRWDRSRHEDGRVLNGALRRMGYGPELMTAHGFRAMAATTLSEQGWPSEVIEHQLAHVDKNAVRAAYQRSELVTERRRMVQAWADWLDMRCAWAVLGR